MVTLGERLERLGRVTGAVRDLGLTEPAAASQAAVDRARRRAGFAGAAYVLALAGGTGVGKSSILNALAGRTVSAVRAIRPTTDEPIAWVAEDRRVELEPLLDWLGVRHVAAHADESMTEVAILDLPDVDSVRTDHRARVDHLLPRIDALAWVIDPEKYDDERLHAYLRSLTSHEARTRFILNKIDRLDERQRDEVVEDLGRRLREAGHERPRIYAVSALTGDGIEELRAALAAEADSKALVVAKLDADARDVLLGLARSMSVAPSGYQPLLTDDRRTDAIGEAVHGAIEVMDPVGVASQVQAAILGRARRTGGSLVSRLIGLVGSMTGQQSRRADPAAYLREWRRRGSLGRVVNPVRAALVEAASRLPPGSRAPLLGALGADDLEESVARVLDRVALDAAGELRLSGSVLWPLIGAAQLVAGAVTIFAIAWYATLFVAAGQVPVSSVELPLIGPVPVPLVLLAGSILVSALLGYLLSLHAGWIGRRHGRRLAERTRHAVAEAIEGVGLDGLRSVERARSELSEALSAN
jgi:GTP-binding protein EngB required for normal cell division